MKRINININIIFWSLLLVFPLTCCDNSKAGSAEQAGTQQDAKKNKSGKKQNEGTSSQVKIIEKWDMPGILREISGIAYLGKDQLPACRTNRG